MIENVSISGYRSFRRLQVDGLTRFNLFVGRNNAGKTALLDAIDLYLQRATPEALFRASDRRGEGRYFDVGDPEASGNWHEGILDLRLLMHGREVKPGASFTIEEADGGSLRCRVDKGPNGSGRPSPLVVNYEWRPAPGEGEVASAAIPMSGTRITWSLHRFRDFSGSTWTQDGDAPSVRFLRTSADPVSQLSADWNGIALTDREDAVVSALRAIEPDIERIAYLGGAGIYPEPEGFVVTLGNGKARVPLGSLGDGVKRILAVIVNAVSASGGAFLVDEIDTGLHHTAMLAMWRSLLAVAHAQDVQVFATTHSIDCVYALGQLVAEGQEPSGAVSLHRIEASEERTVRYTGAEIAAVARSGMEVR